MKLPNGITGFYEKTNIPPNIDCRHFKDVCFHFITSRGGTVLEYKEPLATTNFFDVKVSFFKRKFHILLNAHYPYLAFASVVNFGKIIFIDEPELGSEFRPNFRVLNTEELNVPILIKSGSEMNILQNENELNRAELEQISYWKPKTIGEVIFNYWD